MGSDDRRLLSSWKEIAAYLRVSVRTAQLWESERGLPVTRPPGRRGVVWADADELDAWRKSSTDSLPKPSPPGAPTGRRAIIPVLAASASLAIVAWAVMPVAGPRDKAVRNLTLASSPGEEAEATFSPDASLIAFAWNGECNCEPRNLYVKPVAGGPARRLTNGPWQDQFPQWSPDGKWIAFGRSRGSEVDIVLVSPDGAQERTVTRLRNLGERRETAISWVSWLPDSRSAAIIERSSLDSPYAVYRLSLETGEREQLTFPPQGITGEESVSFSPDGRYMAFARYQNGTSSDLFLASFDGKEPQRLTHDGIYHSGLAWTPDSSALIYGAQRQSVGWSLWRLEPSLFGEAQPVRVPGAEEDASWPAVASAPHGEGIRIAYTHSRLTTNLLRWDSPWALDAAPPRTLCPSTRSDVAVQYSRDGSRIAFVSSREERREIWVCNADGSQPRRITSLEGQQTDSPRWSPDGQRLAFTTAVDENRDVWIADVRTLELRRLTQEPSHEGRPTWSSDGRWIYFRSNRSGRDEIWKTPSGGGGQAVQLTKSGAFESFEALDGSRLYFTKDRDYRGVWSVPTTGGEAALVVEGAREGLWSVAADGIYFLVDAEIRAHRFSTGEVETVATIPGSPSLRTGFSVRPDGQSFLWCQVTRDDQDIMMLEGLVP